MVPGSESIQSNRSILLKLVVHNLLLLATNTCFYSYHFSPSFRLDILLIVLDDTS